MIDRFSKLDEKANKHTKSYSLPKETELRIRAEFDPNIYIKVGLSDDSSSRALRRSTEPR